MTKTGALCITGRDIHNRRHFTSKLGTVEEVSNPAVYLVRQGKLGHLVCKCWMACSVECLRSPTLLHRLKLLVDSMSRTVVSDRCWCRTSDTGASAVIGRIGDQRATALGRPMHLICSVGFTSFTTSQRLQLSAARHRHIVRASLEAVIKCNAWRHQCVGRVLVLDRWAARRQSNSLSCHSCRTALYENGTSGVRIMKLTDLTS